MRYNFFILLSLIVTAILFLSIVTSIEPEQENTLNKTNTYNNSFQINNSNTFFLKSGKNTLFTDPSFKPTYVKEFIKKYPEITVISYEKENSTIGFINLFGGIGKNFIIYPNMKYELVTKNEVQIKLI